MAFPDSFLNELVSRNEISDVVSDYVHLSRKGSNLFGICPFHSEKTASFSVSTDKQIYHCFGCSKGGGVINFIMEIENLSYPDAVRFLAKRAGMEVPEDGGKDERARRERLYAVNRAAARFYHECLASPQCKKMVEYVARRGISGRYAVKFGIGAAPDAWDMLTAVLKKQGFTLQEMADAGLILKNKNGGYYDRFRNRLMFPIIDVRGEVVGFGGRVMDDSTPKYLNSPESAIFSKSRNLFGLNLAKKSKAGYIIVCEGYMDVLSMHQAGFDNAVASLGTALTAEHGRMLSRYTKEVRLAYDSDEAGVKAAQRAISILGQSALAVKVIRMNGAKDPDEYIKKYGADAFRKVLEQSENHIEYRLLSTKSKYDLTRDDERVEFIQEAAKLLAYENSAAAREVYGVKAAEMAGISPESMTLEVNRAFKRIKAAERKKREREQSEPERLAQPREKTIKYNNIRSAAAEEGVIRLLMLDETLEKKTGILKVEDFSSPFLGKVYSIICERITAGKTVSLPLITAELTADEASHLTEILQKPERMSESERALSDYIEVIETEKMKESDDLLSLSKRLREKKSYGG